MRAMSMPRAPSTTVRRCSPSSHSAASASSGERVTELRGLLVRVVLVGHRPAADLRASGAPRSTDSEKQFGDELVEAFVAVALGGEGILVEIGGADFGERTDR